MAKKKNLLVTARQRWCKYYLHSDPFTSEPSLAIGDLLRNGVLDAVALRRRRIGACACYPYRLNATPWLWGFALINTYLPGHCDRYQQYLGLGATKLVLTPAMTVNRFELPA